MRKLWRIDKFAQMVGGAAWPSTLSGFAVPLNAKVEESIRNKQYGQMIRVFESVWY